MESDTVLCGLLYILYDRYRVGSCKAGNLLSGMERVGYCFMRFAVLYDRYRVGSRKAGHLLNGMERVGYCSMRFAIWQVYKFTTSF